jgi:hypothetical protein
MIDRVIEIVSAVALITLTAVVVWRHQNKPEATEASEKKEAPNSEGRVPR